MKKMIVSVAFITAGVSALAQQAGGPSAALPKKFDQLFQGATEVHWYTNAKVVGISFNYHQEVSIAYFTKEGELIANGRRIPEMQLPMATKDKLLVLKNDHEKKYGSLSMSSIYEFSRDGDTEYIITLENDKTSLIVASKGGELTVRKKIGRRVAYPDVDLIAREKR